MKKLATALDETGNSATSSVTVTVDNTPPETVVTSTSGVVSPATATFEFAASEAGARFECSLDGSGYAGCVSPKTYSGLTPGSHTFSVQAIDALGNADPTPASYSWTVADTTPPETTITAGCGGRRSGTGTPFFSGGSVGAAGARDREPGAPAPVTAPQADSPFASAPPLLLAAVSHAHRQ